MRIKLDEGAYTPERAHDTDAGLDLRSREDKVVPAGGSAVFDTGVRVELPKLNIGRPISGGKPILSCDGTVNFERVSEIISVDLRTAGFLKSKSGLNVKHGITSEGVIDESYRGSIVVKLYNHGKEDYQVKKGDKISQLVILPVLTPKLEAVDKLEDTERGDNGFGSSGR